MRFFLRAFYESKDVEVTREQYIHAERNMGFFPKNGTGIATAAFAGRGVSGHVVYEDTDYVYADNVPETGDHGTGDHDVSMII